MKKVIFTLFAASALFLTSCKNEKDPVNSDRENMIDTIQTDVKTAENSINYDGTYKGILPCFEKDCKEVEMEIKLLPNNGYVYSTIRLGLDDHAIMTTGTFQFKEDGHTIVFGEIANVPNAFLVEEGKIIQLDRNQQKITSADSAKFVLIKE